MLVPYDDQWPALAAQRLAGLRKVLDPLDESGSFDYQHIGSTSVPGLAAKPFLDLQVRMPTLPPRRVLDEALRPTGFRPEPGARPDSPGVHRDHPRGSAVVPDEVWAKCLYTAREPDSVLHVRRSDSPWGHYTVLFRDWLRAHPEQAAHYEHTKRTIAAAHADAPDYDDYTRAKTAYFEEVQDEFERWARARLS